MKKALNIIVSFGAAVVIFGAWAKLLHKSYADTMLTIGLITEAAIFILYGIIEFWEKNDNVEKSQSIVDTHTLSSSISSLESTIKKIFKTH